MMVDVSYQMVLSTLQTAGLLVGIFYYITTLRNAEKNRIKEMVFRRMETRTPQYFLDVYDASPPNFEYETVEDFHSKYNVATTPELMAKRASIQDKLNAWGYLLKEGLINIELIGRLHSPSFIQHWWEANKSIYLEVRKAQGNPEFMADFEYLYNAIMKKYPDSQVEPRFLIKKG
jgi:hypothetical protein